MPSNKQKYVKLSTILTSNKQGWKVFFVKLLTTHEIINQRIDGAICITQPVRQQRKHRNHFTLINFRERVANDVQRVNGKKTCSEHYHDGDQHFWSFPSSSQLSYCSRVGFTMTKVDFIWRRRREKFQLNFDWNSEIVRVGE